jgi:hypothetical protein
VAAAYWAKIVPQGGIRSIVVAVAPPTFAAFTAFTSLAAVLTFAERFGRRFKRNEIPAFANGTHVTRSVEFDDSRRRWAIMSFYWTKLSPATGSAAGLELVHIQRQLKRPVFALWMNGRQPLQFGTAECVIVNVVAILVRTHHHDPAKDFLMQSAQDAVKTATGGNF